jgi:uncharacterized protein (TIGR02145 family)
MKKLLLNVAFLVASFTSSAQVGIGTATPDASAALEIESTTKGFLPPRMTLVQINAIATPAEGLMVYCLDGATKGLLVNNGVEFISIINGESLKKVAVAAIVADANNPAAGGTPSLADLTAVGVTNLTGAQTVYEEAIADASPAPTTLAELQVFIDAVNNIGKDTTTTVVDLASPTGRIWMDRNLGATQAAASSTDVASYGDLYQWGRAKDGHESRTSNTTATTATSAAAGHGDFITAGAGTDYNWTDFADEDTLWQSGLNDPCPTGYRIPAEIELQTELDEFSSNDAAGAFSALKLPLAGYRNRGNGTLNDVGLNGYYWSSTVSSTNARYLKFKSNNAYMSDNNRVYGLSVRCIKD